MNPWGRPLRRCRDTTVRVCKNHKMSTPPSKAEAAYLLRIIHLTDEMPSVRLQATDLEKPSFTSEESRTYTSSSMFYDAP